MLYVQDEIDAKKDSPSLVPTRAPRTRRLSAEAIAATQKEQCRQIDVVILRQIAELHTAGKIIVGPARYMVHPTPSGQWRR